jgi:hypothetical protein
MMEFSPSKSLRHITLPVIGELGQLELVFFARAAAAEQSCVNLSIGRRHQGPRRIVGEFRRWARTADLHGVNSAPAAQVSRDGSLCC